MEKILRATMKIICLLIGQENVAVKKCGNTVLIEPPPRSLKKNDNQKVLELANKIIELLTVERLLDVTTDDCKDVPQSGHQAVCSSQAYPDTTSMFLKPSSEHVEEAMPEKAQKSPKDITEVLCTCKKGDLKDGDMGQSVQQSSICVQVKADLNNEDHMADMCSMEELSSLNIKEEPFSEDEDSYTEAVVSTPADESLYTAVNIKTESFSNEETEYTTNDLKEESSFGADEGNLGSTPFHIIKVLRTSIDKKTSRKLNTSQIIQPNTDGMYCCQDCRKFSHFVKCQMGHRVKKIPCPQCGENFSCNSALARHQTAHTEEQMFACFECGKNMSSKPALLVHQRIHKGKSHIVGLPINHIGETFCSSKAAIVLQQRLHMGKAFYSCSKCGKRFLQKTCLQQHLRTHTGEKPHACSECGERFIQKSHLKQHLKVHLPKKKETFSCSECGKCYKRRADFRWHMLIHLGEK